MPVRSKKPFTQSIPKSPESWARCAVPPCSPPKNRRFRSEGIRRGALSKLSPEPKKSTSIRGGWTLKGGSLSSSFPNPGITIFALFIVSASALNTFAQKPRVPPGGHLAIVADERLAALRGSPDTSARLIRRLSRGRFVSIRGASRTRDGLTFYHVAINRRTAGWLQSEAVISSWRARDDERLTRLLDGADEFDRVARARIFFGN